MTAARWSKRGLAYVPDRTKWWARNGYAFLPTAQVRAASLRVYFASLDEHNYGRIGFVDVDPTDPRRILGVSAEPVLDVGPRGAFDDSGVNPSSVVEVDGRTLLYYIGWQRCERVPYMLFSGLAVEQPDGTFHRYASVPVLDRTADEPFSRSAAYVIRDGTRLRAWYWSCLHWSDKGGLVHYNNVIRHAESGDGLHWTTTPGVCLAPSGDREYSVGRPAVVIDDGLYRMWFSVRGHDVISYRIGYAESADGLAWQRIDARAGIQPGPEAWDAEMICHPNVVTVQGRRYLFYNGNHHGQDGFGFAVADE